MPTRSETASLTIFYHPCTEFKGCTNSPSGTYPVQWDQSDMASRYLYESYEACCNTFFRNKDCAKMDVCYVVPQDCSTLKWLVVADSLI